MLLFFMVGTFNMKSNGKSGWSFVSSSTPRWWLGVYCLGWLGGMSTMTVGAQPALPHWHQTDRVSAEMRSFPAMAASEPVRRAANHAEAFAAVAPGGVLLAATESSPRAKHLATASSTSTVTPKSHVFQATNIAPRRAARPLSATASKRALVERDRPLAPRNLPVRRAPRNP